MEIVLSIYSASHGLFPECVNNVTYLQSCVRFEE
jgi:hypothetical protein